MPDPIIVDGDSQKITITLPSSAKQVALGIFTVEPDPGDAFKNLVVWGADRGETAVPMFKTDQLTTNWKVKLE